jgi:FkbM family methyltransferase
VLKKSVRSAVTFFPGLQDFRFSAQSALLRLLDRPYRSEYRGVRVLKDTLLVDIGAHRGMSISTLRTMKPGARIIAFEPNYLLAEKLRQRYAADQTVRVEPCGLGERAGEFILYVPVYRGYRFDGLASISRQIAENWLNADRMLWFDPSKLVIDEMRIRIRTLDEFGLAPFLIKIYVQGHEKEVVAGAKETIERHHPVILTPAKNAGVDASLRRFGYKRYSWVGKQFVEEADVGFIVFYLQASHLQNLGDLKSSSHGVLF